jgi:hypothetical protein
MRRVQTLLCRASSCLLWITTNEPHSDGKEAKNEHSRNECTDRAATQVSSNLACLGHALACLSVFIHQLRELAIVFLVGRAPSFDALLAALGQCWRA